MFCGIGIKIKFFAKVLCWVGVAIFVLIGIFSIFNGIINESVAEAFGGFLLAIIGSLFSWGSSLVLYGFGELIENTSELVNLKKMEIESNKETK